MMNEVMVIYDKYRKDEENGTVVRMPRVPYTTSFLTQVDSTKPINPVQINFINAWIPVEFIFWIWSCK